MNKSKLISLLLVLVFSLIVSAVLADGTETLGEPSIAIAPGTGVVAGGVGTFGATSGSFTLDVPAGATVNQALLYWAGEFRTVPDTEISVNGNPVAGTSIGGPTLFYSNVYVESFRADITALGLIGPGTNNILIEEMSFDAGNSGAGILVIYEEVGASSEIAVRDGNDLAFVNFAPPLDTTVPQTFSFAAADTERFAKLEIFAGSVGAMRPNAITVASGGVLTTIINPFGSADGPLWDTAHLQVAVPAGVTSITVQVLSQSDGSGNLPASLLWIGAALELPVPEDGGGEGCTPGFWKQPAHLSEWPSQLAPDDDFDDTFGVDYFTPNITLHDAVWARGGGINELARHGTAALLNAYSSAVDYPLSADEVIAAVQAGNVSELVAYNELMVPGFCD